jgi:hypothetical protein
MSKFRLLLCGILSILLVGSLGAKEKQESNNSQSIISMPINHLGTNHLSLVVKTPENFHALETPTKGIRQNLLEFIPNGEDKQKWSYLITLSMRSPTATSSAEFVQNLKTGFEAQAKNSKILENDSITKDKYNQTTLGIAYEYQGRRELVYMRYYSGPIDLCGIQYAKALAQDESVEMALKDLKKRVDKIAEVVNQ